MALDEQGGVWAEVIHSFIPSRRESHCPLLMLHLLRTRRKDRHNFICLCENVMIRIPCDDSNTFSTSRRGLSPTIPTCCISVSEDIPCQLISESHFMYVTGGGDIPGPTQEWKRPAAGDCKCTKGRRMFCTMLFSLRISFK